jgi:3-hydroxy-9,10-secoandrosta-1,3,5(10)-triene-9,17-dione monooxygenase
MAASKNELLERAEKLVPALRERAARADSERKVPAETIADMRDAGLLDVLLPRALGGSEVDFSVFSTITRLLATGCGSTAWVYAILTETAWIAALFPQKAQEEVWEDRSALFCARSCRTARRGKWRAGIASRAAGNISADPTTPPGLFCMPMSTVKARSELWCAGASSI